MVLRSRQQPLQFYSVIDCMLLDMLHVRGKVYYLCKNRHAWLISVDLED